MSNEYKDCTIWIYDIKITEDKKRNVGNIIVTQNKLYKTM